MGDKGTIHGTSDGGTTGKHEPVDPFQFLVGTSTADQFNTAILRLLPIACFRVDDVRFSFDSSFPATDPTDPKKDIRAELEIFVQLQKDFPESPLSIFGHADPVGNDDYNKQLSGRRSTVIYALLISSTGSGRSR
jgi:outer membrane protein OmpA-like peptidoglycan-associated protein